jgi:hypothetical protein
MVHCESCLDRGKVSPRLKGNRDYDRRITGTASIALPGLLEFKNISAGRPFRLPATMT